MDQHSWRSANGHGPPTASTRSRPPSAMRQHQQQHACQQDPHPHQHPHPHRHHNDYHYRAAHADHPPPPPAPSRPRAASSTLSSSVSASSSLQAPRRRADQAPAPAPPAPARVPRLMVGLESKYSIHHFQLLEPVGRPGSSGTVFRARTDLPDLAAKPLAVKVIPKAKLTTMDAYTRVKNECLVHRQLDHPTIPTLYTAMEDHDHIYLVMELCERGTLQDYLERRTAHCLPESEARWVLQKVAQGLVHLATNGIIHRDLKPANILLTRDNQVKIGDFGLAKSTAAVEAKATDATVCGTLNFMAPEVTHKTGYSAKVDVWALGCLAVTLLTGKPPFDSGPGQVARTLDAIRTAQYLPPEFLSPDARDLITKLLNKNPRHRPTVHQVLEHVFFRPSQIFVPLQPLDDRDRDDGLAASPDHRDAPRYPSSVHDCRDRAPHARASAPSSLPRTPADAGYGGSAVSSHRSFVGHHPMVPPTSAPPSHQPQQQPQQYVSTDPSPASYRQSTGYTHPVAPLPSQPIRTAPAPSAPPHDVTTGPPGSDPTLLSTEYCRISQLSVKGHTICVLDTGELVVYRNGAPEILAISRDGRWAHIYRAQDVFTVPGTARPDLRNATPVAEFPHTHLVAPWTAMYRLGKKLTDHIRAQSLLVVMDARTPGHGRVDQVQTQPMLELTSAEVRFILRFTLHPGKGHGFLHPARTTARCPGG
ncbi:PLK/SAK protein kinase [Allomyces macrogynus ATCC 38327]|uniref:PLK/SAK protein kinase n=1 Tax=Allomyces macrogynus (strain ATCC 38327) TaxID=578462 RepID=A0A0L0S6E4_ALLM3|nr:PLK/SAK protein kinase [Allomyces macrogynus ATCC 38327]|eukprot:KNE58173.1 PLK/SAK protein kinase [Allomyces macrogynus ATCC 38327]